MAQSSNLGVTFRHCHPDDALQILDILTAAYGRWPRFDIPVEPIEHLRWQLDSPSAAIRSDWVAEVGNEIGSIHLGYPRTGWLSGEEVSMWYGADSATAPASQGRGLYSKLRDNWLEEVRLEYDLFATSPVHAVVVHTLAKEEQGVNLGNAIQVHVKVIDAKRMAQPPATSRGLRGNAQLRRLAFSGLKLFGALRPRRNKWPKDTARPHRIDHFDHGVDSLWLEARQQFDFILERRKDFLNWRYCDPRGGAHIVLAAEDQGRILGYIVVRMSEGRGHIVDLLALPDRNDVVSSLVAAAEDYARQAGVAALHCQTVRSHPYNAVLAAHGFVNFRRPLNFVCLPMRLEPAKLAVLKRTDAAVHLTDGDLI